MVRLTRRPDRATASSSRGDLGSGEHDGGDAALGAAPEDGVALETARCSRSKLGSRGALRPRTHGSMSRTRLDNRSGERGRSELAVEEEGEEMATMTVMADGGARLLRRWVGRRRGGEERRS